VDAGGAAKRFGAKRLVDLAAAREGIFVTNRKLYLRSCAVVALMAGFYFRNPIGSASYDPRLRFFGVTIFRDPSRSMEPTMKLDHIFVTSASRTMAPVRVPAGQFFILGDNRDISSDSRIWGFLPRRAVVGRVN
jgi:hypothetical protein